MPTRTVSQVEQAISAFAERMESALRGWLPQADGPESRLCDAMRYAALGGGKYLRPYLVDASAAMFGVSPTCRMRVGAAVEMVHAYSLVHDDLPAMDDDDLRRGRASCHVAFGEATAILAGDALLTLAFETLASSDTHPDGGVRSELVLALARASGARGMTGGQMIDLESEHAPVAADAVSEWRDSRPARCSRFPPPPAPFWAEPTLANARLWTPSDRNWGSYSR